MLTTATCVSARNASRSAWVMARDMGAPPPARTYCSRRAPGKADAPRPSATTRAILKPPASIASRVHHPRGLVGEAGHGAPRDQLEVGRNAQALADALGEPAGERARIDTPRRVVLDPHAQRLGPSTAAHDLVVHRRPRHLRELVEDERHVDGQDLDVTNRHEVAHPPLVEQAPVSLAAGAGLLVPAHHVLEVVAEEEV